MPISEDCYKLAGSLFASWALISAAHRYAIIEEKEKALQATSNARAAVFDAAKEGAMTQEEARALDDDLNEVIRAIEFGGPLMMYKSGEWREFTEGRERLESLSEQVFMRSLEKVVDCECGEAKAIEEALGKEALHKILGQPDPEAVRRSFSTCVREALEKEGLGEDGGGP